MKRSEVQPPPVREMHEIRIVGRGGHGVVTAGEMLGRAAVGENRFAQSIPTFGPERRGALSSCTLRIGPEPILLRCGPMRPDILLVLDPTIWKHLPVTLGLAEGATLVFNSAAAPAELAPELRLDIGRYDVFTVNATAIGLEVLGRPIPNTAMIGAWVGATGIVAMESVERVIEERFGAKAEANITAARTARARLRRLGD